MDSCTASKSSFRRTRILACLVLIATTLGFAAPVAAVEPPTNGDTGIWGGVDRFDSGVDDDKELFRDVAIIDDRVFAGGFFTNVRAGAGGTRTNQRFLAAYDRYSGQFIDSFRPTFNGPILEVEASPDGTRLFVGGDFTQVNGQAIDGFVSLDPWTGDVQTDLGVTVRWSYSGSISVDAITVDGDWLYIGGNLTHVTDSTGTERFRNRAARVSISTGRLDGWRPRISAGRVATIAVDSARGRVYIGGRFTHVNNAATAGFVSVNETDAELTSGVTQGQHVEFRDDHFPYDIEVFPGYVAYAGDMELIVKRDSDLDTIYQWRYGSFGNGLCRPDGDVQAVEYIDGHLYFGGHFTDIFSNQGCTTNGNDRTPIGRWDPATQNLDSSYYRSDFDASGANPSIWGMVADENDVMWIAGIFSQVGTTSTASLSRLTPAGVDSTRPTPTNGLATTAIGDTTVDLAWNASTDASGIANYQVYVATPAQAAAGARGDLVTTVATTAASVTGLVLDTDYVLSVRAIDNNGIPGVLRSLDARTSNLLTLTSPGDQMSPLNSGLTLQLDANSSAGLTLTYAATNLPGGLTLDSATGAITGIPNVLADNAVSVTVTDINLVVRSADFRWQVLDGSAPIVSFIPDRTTARDQADAVTPVASGATAHTATGLPAGITVDSATGVMSGTPTVAGAHAVTYTASTPLGFETSRTFTWYVTAPLTEVIVTDNFETDAGWTLNPNGTDTATTGHWSHGSPSRKTSGSWVVQLGDVTSGTRALVTDPAGGAGGNGDVDNGVTTSLSPVYAIPADAVTARVEFDYYGGITYNPSRDGDAVRVHLVTDNGSTVIAQKIGPNRQSAVWEHVNHDISAFAGQNIRILVEAADPNPGGWVEGGIDTLSITVTRGAAPVGPQPVAGCTAAPVGTDVHVSWPAATGADNYVIYRSFDGGTTFWRGRTQSLEFTDTARGTNMQYSIQTTNDAGQRSAITDCNPLVNTPLDPPLAPLQCTASVVGVDVAVEWPAGANADEYIVSRSIDGGTVFWRGRVTTLNFDDAARGDLMQYSVVSVSSDGRSSGSVDCNPINAAPIVVSPVASCTITQVGADVTIDWPANGSAEYVIRRTIDGGSAFWRGRVAGTTFDDTLRPGTTVYSVTAKDSGNTSTPTTCSPEAVL